MVCKRFFYFWSFVLCLFSLASLLPVYGQTESLAEYQLNTKNLSSNIENMLVELEQLAKTLENQSKQLSLQVTELHEALAVSKMRASELEYSLSALEQHSKDLELSNQKLMKEKSQQISRIEFQRNAAAIIGLVGIMAALVFR